VSESGAAVGGITGPPEPVPPVDARHERRHVPPGDRADWQERWWLDFAGSAGSPAGYVRLSYHPAEGVAWFWAAVVVEGRPLVAVRAHDVRIPRLGTEIRTDGVWASLTCESPLEHWSVGLESFGAAFEDPLEAWGGERGDVVPFGLELEWESVEPALPASAPGASGYGQWCAVHGDVLIGEERLEVDATGHREHLWGTVAPRGWRVAAAGDDGARRWAREGWTVGAPTIAAGVPDAELIGEWRADDLPGNARFRASDGAVLELVPAASSPVAVPGCRVVNTVYRSQSEQGTPGRAWVSWWGGR
jgi:hypothetical protein